MVCPVLTLLEVHADPDLASVTFDLIVYSGDIMTLVVHKLYNVTFNDIIITLWRWVEYFTHIEVKYVFIKFVIHFNGMFIVRGMAAT